MQKLLFLVFVLFIARISVAQNQFPVPTGNVGINFPSPTEALCVGGNINLTGNVITANGNVGIGTTNPQTRLHVEGGGYINGELLVGATKNDVGLGQRVNWDNSGNTDPIWMARYNLAPDATEFRMNVGDDGGSADKFVIGYNFYGDGLWKPQMMVRMDGQVGIGTANINDGTYKLYVETGIRTRKVRVDALTWSDYVFHKNYLLPSLGQVEKFVRKNQHLPDVPSAAEVEKEGIDLGSNQALLLKKIEELTLYMIEADKQLKAQQERIRRLERLVTKHSVIRRKK